MVAAQLAGASSGDQQPLRIQSTKLVQSGQDLVWQVTMQRPFSPEDLAPAGRSLCLVLQQGRNTSAGGRLCVAGPRKGGHRARLVYVPATGRTRTITATITRSSHSELTASFLPSATRLTYRSIRWQVASTLTTACTATATATSVGAGPAGASCTQVASTKLASLKLHTPKLVGCIARGPKWVFSGSAKVHDIALTFDDGPSPDPPASDFVNLLHREHVPATFFEIGDQIPEYDPTGAVERRMLTDGDMIGDHTWNHPDMLTLSVGQQRQELAKAASAIRHATGFQPCLFRAPYGDVDSELLNLARSMGFTTIEWDVDPRDWALPGVNAIYLNVVDNAHNGAIVIQHFGGGPRYETLAALPKEIATLRKRGYRFVTVTKMLGYKLVYR